MEQLDKRPTERKCRVCGEVFWTNTARRVCSDACRYIWQRKWKSQNQWKPKKTCNYCGVDFIASSKSRKYCSLECAEAAKRKLKIRGQSCACGAPAVDKFRGEWICGACLNADQYDVVAYRHEPFRNSSLANVPVTQRHLYQDGQTMVQNGVPYCR